MTSLGGRRLFLKSLTSGLTVGSVMVARADSSNDRIEQCFRLRSTAAAYKLSEGDHKHPINGDEKLYHDGAASYSKALPHDASGRPLKEAYQKLIAALTQGTFEALEAVPLGGTLKLSNPLAENAFELEGLDSCQFVIPAPPDCSSLQQAAEMAELYWQSLIRDVPFSRWENEATIASAVADLSRYDKSLVTHQNLFRLPFKGVFDGPYVSQFLLLPVPNGNMIMEQRYLSAVPGQSFGTAYSDWLAIQNGRRLSTQTQFETSPRYISTPRSLAEYVHRDYTFQAFLCASLLLSDFGPEALSDTNPYKWSKAQAGFVTFGVPHVIDSMARAANATLKAAWFQKWMLHRRIRPEEYAARVNATITDGAEYPVHSDLSKSSSLSVLHFANGSYLLPLAYPEGCPAHPAYPAGHAAVAGACATMLKAFFREEFELPKPIVSDASGKTLVPHSTKLMVGGELNKLAANIAMARNFAGVHWRSDSEEGIRLGEAVAISLLKDSLETLPEKFSGFSFTGFDGHRIVISKGNEHESFS